jgi:hypothetical protein
VLVILGFIIKNDGEFYNLWFAFGLLPLIAGIMNFCPLCIISKKCDVIKSNG